MLGKPRIAADMCEYNGLRADEVNINQCYFALAYRLPQVSAHFVRYIKSSVEAAQEPQ